MLPVSIDITRLAYRRLTGHLPTGIDRVSLEYVRHFRGRGRAVLVVRGRGVTLSKADSLRTFDWLIEPSGAHRLGALARLIVSGARALVDAGTAPHFFFNTAHSGLQHAGYLRAMRRPGRRPIFVVHDLIPLSHPEYCRPGERERHARRIRHMLVAGHGLVVNSGDTLFQLERYAKLLGLAVPPAVVAHLAPGLSGARAGPQPLAPPYFVVLGTIEPRKNHAFLLKVWRTIADRLGPATPRLVVIGQRGWECRDAIELLERTAPLRGVVVELAACTDEQLVGYLRHAQALLFPSVAEGFGLPVLEALSLGVPVIASDLAVFREFAGNIPDYADPFDATHWQELILDYGAPASPRRVAQLRRLTGFQPPAWDRHLQVVDALLQRLEQVG